MIGICRLSFLPESSGAYLRSSWQILTAVKTIYADLQ